MLQEINLHNIIYNYLTFTSRQRFKRTCHRQNNRKRPIYDCKTIKPNKIKLHTIRRNPKIYKQDGIALPLYDDNHFIFQTGELKMKKYSLICDSYRDSNSTNFKKLEIKYDATQTNNKIFFEMLLSIDNNVMSNMSKFGIPSKDNYVPIIKDMDDGKLYNDSKCYVKIPYDYVTKSIKMKSRKLDDSGKFIDIIGIPV